jgi:hypothetical protein
MYVPPMDPVSDQLFFFSCGETCQRAFAFRLNGPAPGINVLMCTNLVDSKWSRGLLAYPTFFPKRKSRGLAELTLLPKKVYGWVVLTRPYAALSGVL